MKENRECWATRKLTKPSYVQMFGPTKTIVKQAMAADFTMLGSPLPLHSRTVITNQYRYSQYSSGDVELYDLDSDPKELENLAVRERADAHRGEMAEKLAGVMMSYSSMGTRGVVKMLKGAVP